MNYRWFVQEGTDPRAVSLAGELGITPLLATMLVERGLIGPDEASVFLNPSLDRLHDPFLMKDMDRVVKRVFEARERREKVLIYGDYDVDGITSTVVLRRALQMLGVEADFHLPRRLEDGYGLQKDVIERAHQQGYSLVLTADSGVRAFDVCELARALGLDLVVTDHHLPDRELPCAFAILNPRRNDCPYPEKNLAAVGVVFKLVDALFREFGREPDLTAHFLKLVAIGTIADLVPITGENRIICKYGLAGLAQPRNIGLKALLEGSGVSREVDHFDVGFKVAPRINAVTRMGGGREVVDLFSLRDESKARVLVEDMNHKNVRRRAEEQAIIAEIEERWREDPEPFERRFLVVVGKGWHRGVIGIVASRLVERFYRPTLVLSQDESGCQGSARSIPGFHLLRAFDSCRGCFSRYGGHAQAAGCSLDLEGSSPEALEELSRRLDDYSSRMLSDEDLIPSLRIESVLPVQELRLGLCSEIQRLAPFGVGNPVPVFASRGALVAAGPWVLKDAHLKMRIQRNGSSVNAIWWRRADAVEKISAGSLVDLAYTVDQNHYQGEDELLLTVKDVQAPECRVPNADAD